MMINRPGGPEQKGQVHHDVNNPEQANQRHAGDDQPEGSNQ